MNNNNIRQDNISDEDIFLIFIDEERIKDTEIRFSLYIKKAFNFDENENTEKSESENDEGIDEHPSHIIKFRIKIN